MHQARGTHEGAHPIAIRSPCDSGLPSPDRHCRRDSYTVTIELSGFQTQTAEVTLATGDRARIDARLRPGGLEEELTVTAATPLLQTDSATVSSLIGDQEVQDLPTSGRNVTRLIQLIPGANEGLPNSLASGTRPDDRRQTSAISINGARDNQNNHLIDGMDNNDRTNGTIGIKPSTDAIGEVRIQTNMYTAEVSRTAGGVINILTKSGSNQFHGSGFIFARKDAFEAREFFAAEKPPLDEQQFGGSLGGPVVRDKTFFFVDYEGFRSESGVSNVTTVPTQKMRNGDFSELSVPIFDSLTREPFPNSRIPTDRIDAIGQRYMDLYPLPTDPGLGSNYRSVTNRSEHSNTFDIRIDHRINDASSVFGRVSYNDVETFTPSGCPVNDEGINPNCDTGGSNPFPGPNETAASNVQMNVTRTWNPTLVSEVRVGYLGLEINSLPVNFGRNVSDEFGMPGVNIDETTSGLTPISVGLFESR